MYNLDVRVLKFSEEFRCIKCRQHIFKLFMHVIAQDSIKPNKKENKSSYQSCSSTLMLGIDYLDSDLPLMTCYSRRCMRGKYNLKRRCTYYLLLLNENRPKFCKAQFFKSWCGKAGSSLFSRLVYHTVGHHFKPFHVPIYFSKSGCYLLNLSMVLKGHILILSLLCCLSIVNINIK